MMDSVSSFRSLPGIYEPSAIVQLPDGRFLVAEDELEHPFSLLTIDYDGQVSHRALTAGWFDFNEAFWKVDDLEGLTIDPSGWVYAASSQSRQGDGDRKKAREKLVRFRIEGERVVDAHSVTTLKAALTVTHPVLDAAARVLDVKEDGGFNVEAIEMDPDGRRLWVGFRSPLLDGKALLACFENPADVFTKGAAPAIAPVLEALDLGGHGVRGMGYVPALHGFVLISGPVSRSRSAFRLWFWNGRPGAPVQAIFLPDKLDIGHAEGICPARIDGHERIVVVSDDGSRSEGRHARFLMFDPGFLQIQAGPTRSCS